MPGKSAIDYSKKTTPDATRETPEKILVIPKGDGAGVTSEATIVTPTRLRYTPAG